MSASIDNRRIARNTIVLYFRMLFQMAVYLYTSRVIIDVLGVVDYGIYDVVAGVVVILVFLNNAMTVSTQRFVTVALGKGNILELQKVYSGAILIHIALAVLILLLGETIGYWYMTHRIQIPFDRFAAALMVYHCSIASAIVLVMSVPYNAAIIAYERMMAFAGITITDVCLKLLIVCSLRYVTYDKMETYALLLVAETILVRLIYGVYCKRRLPNLHFSFQVETSLLKEMFNFAKWSMFGNLSIVCNTQGLNLMLNTVGGPVLNAARGVAFQIQTAVTAFIASFQTAINPQITKSYACNDLQAMNMLILKSSRLSFFLILLMALPLIFETEQILGLWLTRVPPHAVSFTRLLLCVAVLDAIANPMMVGAAATGRIKRYHLMVGGTLLATLPLAWLAVRVVQWVEIIFVVQFLMALFAQFIRMILCRGLYKFSVQQFICNVLRPILRVLLLALPLPLLCHIFLVEGLFSSLLIGVVCVVSVAFSVMITGLEENERAFILKKLHL